MAKRHWLDATGSNITDETLKQFAYIERLDIGSNPNITDDGIKHLNCYEFTMSDNKNITSLNHMRDLALLYIYGNCKITDDGIKDLVNLEQLGLTDNPNITKLNFEKLDWLSCSGDSGITNESLEEATCKLNYLYINDNTHITKIPSHIMKEIKIYSDEKDFEPKGSKSGWTESNTINEKDKLDDGSVRIIKVDKRFSKLGLSDNIHVTNEGIKDIDTYELNLSNNRLITKIDHMGNLTALYATGDSAINDDSLNHMNLIELGLNGNIHVTKLSHMSKLESLSISGICGVNNQELEKLNLTKLNIKDNSSISNISSSNNLLELTCSRKYITYEELEKLKINYVLNKYCGLTSEQIKDIKTRITIDLDKSHDVLFGNLLDIMTDTELQLLENKLTYWTNIWVKRNKTLDQQKTILLKVIFNIDISGFMLMFSLPKIIYH